MSVAMQCIVIFNVKIDEVETTVSIHVQDYD